MRLRGQIDGQLADLLIDKGRIVSIGAADAHAAADLGAPDLRIAPGLLDLQINGYHGIDWNERGAQSEQILEAARLLYATGTAAFLPTLITASREDLARGLALLARAIDEWPEVARACPGIHLEGPYISPLEGARGAHPAEHCRAPDWEEFSALQEAAGGRIRIITLAPEWPGALRFIERAAAAGVVVAIGHTAASPAEIDDAVRAGARLSTHLGNGSQAMLPRHSNYIWAQMANDDLAASLIADGQHLPPYVLKSLVRAKGVERSILVTDAISAAGLGPGRHRLGSIEVDVSEEKRVSLPGTPYLAGSVLEMHEAVANAVRFAGIGLDDAIAMATLNPARLLGLEAEYGRLEEGCGANLIIYSWDEAEQRLQIAATIVGGEVVYKNE